MVAVKICGVRTVTAAAACAEAAVEFAGLNFVPGVRRRIEVTSAARLRQVLGATTAVGIFRDAPHDELLRTIDTAELSWVQLHGAEPPELCAGLRARGIRVIKAFPATTLAPAPVDAYREHVDVMLFDAPVAGAGVPWDWGTGRSFARDTSDSVPQHDGLSSPRRFVAGGLTPGNVVTAIETLAPDGVDVASGVETDGDIDPVKIHAFCAAVRAHSDSRLSHLMP